MRSCSFCDDYTEVGTEERKVNRMVFEDEHTYVIVPLESHVQHHLIVALNDHKVGLINCSRNDITYIGETLAKACKVFKDMGYDRVYEGCYSDSDKGHVHFHLIPFINGIDKVYEGHAMHWLAEKERYTHAHEFRDMTQKQKNERLDVIERTVREVFEIWDPKQK